LGKAIKGRNMVYERTDRILFQKRDERELSNAAFDFWVINQSSLCHGTSSCSSYGFDRVSKQSEHQ
jgi:hypothetical protein